MTTRVRPARVFALAPLLLVCASLGATQSPSTQEATGGYFVDRAVELGVDFVHFNGMSGDYSIVEEMPAGGALFDYDNDGDLDLYLVQGRMLGEGKTVADAVFPPQHPLPLTDRLYRNDLVETGVFGFTDVTTESGLRAFGYGMGAATGDYDNDGWTDLYLTNYGANQLWRNRERARTAGSRSRTSPQRPASARSD